MRQSFWQLNKLIAASVSLLTLSFSGVNSISAQTAPTTWTTFIVNSTSDNPNPSTSVMTLRKAIALANKTTGPVVIKFNLGKSPQTITLTQGNLNITNPNSQITIDGSDNTVSVSCNKAARVFSINSSTQVNIQGVNIVGCDTNFL